MNNILVIGGMHGNEKLGIELVKLLKSRPIEGVSAVIANPVAVKNEVRFMETDLNRSFGAKNYTSLEEKRALEIEKMTKSYDLVLDFHNTQTSNNNCTFVGEDCNKDLYQVVSYLGLSECIIATYDCINKYCLNTLSVEISIDDKRDNAGYWYEKIKKLQTVRKLPTKEINKYTFYQRITWRQQQELKLGDWYPFKPVSQQDKQKLNTDKNIVPIFVGSNLTEYYATLVEKVSG